MMYAQDVDAQQVWPSESSVVQSATSTAWPARSCSLVALAVCALAPLLLLTA